MKHFIFSLFALIAFVSNTQAQDFNFTFYPAPKYGKYMERHQLDTLSGKMVLVPDSVKTSIPLIVEKTGDLFVIRDQGNVSAPVYTANVQFQGIADDGKFSLVYRSTAPEAETVIVNPTLGFVVLIYQKCFPVPAPKPKPGETVKPVTDQSKICNFVNHYFGNVSLKSYKP